MSAMGSEATPLCTLPLPPLPCTHQLPRQLLWLFTTITHQQLLPIPPCCCPFYSCCCRHDAPPCP